MRVTIITGGGSGIGAAVARRLAAAETGLMLHGQGADAAGLARLQAVAMDCQRAGARVAWRSGDLADAGTASDLVEATRAALGPIDAIVHAWASRTGAILQSCRARASNDQLPSWPSRFTNWPPRPCRI